MARKAIVNKDEILSMLREGKTTRSIAEKFNVSRQAIDLHRKDFIKKGLLPDKRAARVKEPVKESSPQTQSLISTSPPQPPGDADSLDAQIDLMISAFNALKRLPQLEKDIEISLWGFQTECCITHSKQESPYADMRTCIFLQVFFCQPLPCWQ